MGDPGERGERDRRKRLHHVGTYQPNFPGRVPQIQVAVEDDLGLQPRGAFIVLLPSHPDVTARIPTAAHVHRYPRCLCSSASPGNSCEGIGKNSRVWFFRLGVPVPHKRKYLHKRNECVQGPARGVVFEHRNGALNWSTLAGELCVSRRGRQFVDSSWSCSRTVNRRGCVVHQLPGVLFIARVFPRTARRFHDAVQAHRQFLVVEAAVDGSRGDSCSL